MKRLCRFTPFYNAFFGNFARAKSANCSATCSSSPPKQPEPVTADCAVCIQDQYVLPDPKDEPKVVIIGGGMAGLSAAQRLAHSGFTKFSMYEACDRPGGRIKTHYIGDTVAELGAEVINGGSIANHSYTLAATEGLLESAVTVSYDRFSCWHLTADGRTIDPAIAYETLTRFDEIKAQACELAHFDDADDHGTLLDYMTKRILDGVKDYPHDYRADCARIMTTMLNELRNEVAADLEMVSADKYGRRAAIPPDDRLRVQKGQVRMLAPMLRDIPHGCITYCKPVERIIWGDSDADSRASVQLCDGTSMDADYVIVTLPLGVLKCKADTMFVPKLPERKLNAIMAIGYGHRDRYFLEYAHPFWMQSEGEMLLTRSSDETMDAEDAWVTRLGRFRELPGTRYVLEFEVAGQDAAFLEMAPDVHISDRVTAEFRRFYRDPTIPAPSRIVRSRWSLDPNFCGAYSYYRPKTTPRDFAMLAKPEPDETMPQSEPPVLLFAGEATDGVNYGTTHGARASGIREADRIIRYTAELRGRPPK